MGTDDLSAPDLRALADRFAITEVLTRYATALDHRDWALLDELFTADVEWVFGGRSLHGIDAVRNMIRTHLDGCGQTQHLLANFRIELAGARAESVHSVRAFHAGEGDQRYELFGEYRDALERRPEGWRVTRREMWVSREIGDRSLLGSGAAAGRKRGP
jgi:3-phenylpropionate/cinnamic acid dioxygenase small subunit